MYSCTINYVKPLKDYCFGIRIYLVGEEACYIDYLISEKHDIYCQLPTDIKSKMHIDINTLKRLHALCQKYYEYFKYFSNSYMINLIEPDRNNINNIVTLIYEYSLGGTPAIVSEVELMHQATYCCPNGIIYKTELYDVRKEQFLNEPRLKTFKLDEYELNKEMFLPYMESIEVDIEKLPKFFRKELLLKK